MMTEKWCQFTINSWQDKKIEQALGMSTLTLTLFSMPPRIVYKSPLLFIIKLNFLHRLIILAYFNFVFAISRLVVMLGL